MRRTWRSGTRRSGRRGGTIVEFLVVSLLFVILIGAIGMAIQGGSAAYEQGVANADVEAQTRRMVERIAAEFLDADRSSLVLAPPAPFGATSIDFQRAEAYGVGGVQMGPVRRIQLAYVPGEADDGADNNGNGLVDECRLELVTDLAGAPGEIVGWGGFVREYLEGEVPDGNDDNGNGVSDERGLCLTYEPISAALTIRLTVERLSPSGGSILRTVETAVRLRND